MHFSPIKFSLAIVSFFLLFGFTSASPIASDSETAVATRQESGGIYYGDACAPGDIGDFELMLTVSSKILGGDNYWSTLFLFSGPGCDIIGYVDGVNIENTWYSMDSQLPETINIIAYGGSPQFNYDGVHYGTPNNQWTDYEQPNGWNTNNFQFYFIDF